MMPRAVGLRLLRRLAEGRGRVVTIEALLYAMYADRQHKAGGPHRVLTTMIHQLRRELPPGAIANSHGYGYCLAPDLCERFLADNDDAHVVLARSALDEARFLALRKAGPVAEGPAP